MLSSFPPRRCSVVAGVRQFALGLLVPMSGVLEGFNLRLIVVAARRFEELDCIALGIERRVEIDGQRIRP